MPSIKESRTDKNESNTSYRSMLPLKINMDELKKREHRIHKSTPHPKHNKIDRNNSMDIPLYTMNEDEIDDDSAILPLLRQSQNSEEYYHQNHHYHQNHTEISNFLKVIEPGSPAMSKKRHRSKKHKKRRQKSKKISVRKNPTKTNEIARDILIMPAIQESNDINYDEDKQNNSTEIALKIKVESIEDRISSKYAKRKKKKADTPSLALR